MRAVLPTIGPLERALALQSLPLLRGLRGSGVAVLAQLMREEYVRRGTVLYRAGEPVRAVTVLSEGRIRRERDGRLVDEIDAPVATGLVEVLAGANAATTSTAATNAVVLMIDGSALLDVLEEDFPLLLQIRGELGRQIDALQRALGCYDVPASPAPGEAAAAARPLDLVGRLLWLQHAPVLGEFGVAVHAALLHHEPELRLAPGEVLCREGAEAARFAVVVGGALACTPPDPHGEFQVGAGAIVGIDAVLGATPYGYTATAETPVVAIPVQASVFWDIAEDHFHVAIGAVSACARRLLDLEGRRHADRSPSSEPPGAVGAEKVKKPCNATACPQ
jgi:CRP-like cAMP-binding protein